MLSTRFRPFRDFHSELAYLQNEMNRWFGRSGEGFASSFPPLNIWEDDEAFHVEAELPGLSLEDLEIHVTGGNLLSLQGERQSREVENGSWHRRERGAGKFSRSLELPSDVDPEKVEARFHNGVLSIDLPKAEETRPRRIEVKSV